MSRFRITIWPGVPLPEPWVYRPELVVVDDCIVWPNTLRGAHDDGVLGSGAALPAEAAIRELVRLDVRSASETTEFLRNLGWIDPARRALRRRNVGDLHNQVAGWSPGIGMPTDRAHELALECGATIRAVDAQHELAVVQWCARCELGIDDSHRMSEGWYRALMNAGLRAFHPRVIGVGEETIGGDDVDVIDALYLQLANLALEAAEYKVCPHCAGWFVRQRGRSRSGQYRVAGGVTYCSASCTNAAANRAYRQRKRQLGGGDS